MDDNCFSRAPSVEELRVLQRRIAEISGDQKMGKVTQKITRSPEDDPDDPKYQTPKGDWILGTMGKIHLP